MHTLGGRLPGLGLVLGRIRYSLSYTPYHLRFLFCQVIVDIPSPALQLWNKYIGNLPLDYMRRFRDPIADQDKALRSTDGLPAIPRHPRMAPTGTETMMLVGQPRGLAALAHRLPGSSLWATSPQVNH